MPAAGQLIGNMAKGSGKTRSLWWLFSILGGLAGAFSCVSLIEHLFDVGLQPIMRALLEDYRALIHTLIDVLLIGITIIWPDWSVPSWLKDLYALSFLGAGAFFRYVFAEMVRDGTKPWAAWAVTLPLTLLMGLSMLGLVVLIASIWLAVALAIDRWRSYLDDDQIQTYLGILAALGTGLFGAVAFFLINAQM